MPVPLIGVSVGPSRTLSKVGFCICVGAEKMVLAFARFVINIIPLLSLQSNSVHHFSFSFCFGMKCENVFH